MRAELVYACRSLQILFQTARTCAKSVFGTGWRQGLVEDPSCVSVTVDEPDDEGVVVYHLHVAENDMGRVIGKQGRIAKAIRTVMRAAATRSDEKIAVEID